MTPAVSRLAADFRALGVLVICTRCASLRGDASDQTWRHRAFGLAINDNDDKAQIMAEDTRAAMSSSSHANSI